MLAGAGTVAPARLTGAGTDEPRPECARFASARVVASRRIFNFSRIPSCWLALVLLIAALTVYLLPAHWLQEHVNTLGASRPPAPQASTEPAPAVTAEDHLGPGFDVFDHDRSGLFCRTRKGRSPPNPRRRQRPVPRAHCSCGPALHLGSKWWTGRGLPCCRACCNPEKPWDWMGYRRCASESAMPAPPRSFFKARWSTCARPRQRGQA